MHEYATHAHGLRDFSISSTSLSTCSAQAVISHLVRLLTHAGIAARLVRLLQRRKAPSTASGLHLDEPENTCSSCVLLHCSSQSQGTCSSCDLLCLESPHPSHTATQPHSNTATQPHSHTVTQPHNHTVSRYLQQHIGVASAVQALHCGVKLLRTFLWARGPEGGGRRGEGGVEGKGRRWGKEQE